MLGKLLVVIRGGKPAGRLRGIFLRDLEAKFWGQVQKKEKLIKKIMCPLTHQ